MGTPARFLSGVSTSRVNTPFGNYTKNSPSAAAYYENDFFTYAAGDWTITTTTGSNALTNTIPGGALLLSTAATNNDIQGIIHNSQSMIVTAGNQLWFSCKVRMSDATNSLVQVGIQSGGTIQAPTDGIYFQKANAATAWTLNIEKTSTTTTIAMPSTANAANATDQVLSFYYDGRATPTLFYWIGTKSWPNLNTDNSTFQAIGTTQTFTNLPVAQLAPAVSVKAGAAVIKTLTVDYLHAACEITR